MPTRDIKDAEPLVMRHYAALNLDLLGQGELIQKLRNLPSTDQEKEEYRRNLQLAYARVASLRKDVHDFFNQYRKSPLPTDIDGGDTDTRQRCWNLTDPGDVRVQSFSDTIIAFVPVTRTLGTPLRPQAVYALLAAAGSIMLRWLAHGNPLRGALDVALGFEFDERDLYGPVAVSIYHLEKELAQWPRIVVGQNVLRCLEEAMGNATESADAAKVAADLVTRDPADGALFVDYLGAKSREILGDETVRDLGKKGAAFARAQRKRFIEAGDHKLALRFTQLERYYESRLSE